MSAKLDINALKVATACPARWEDMAGDERARFCQHCQKHVYNFSAMTAKEVEELVVAKEGKLCGRMYRRRDGTVLTADCPTGKAVVQRRRVQWLAMATAGVVTLVSAIWVKAQADEEEDESPLVSSLKEKWYELEVKLGIARPRAYLGAIAPSQYIPPPKPQWNIPPSPPPPGAAPQPIPSAKGTTASPTAKGAP